MIVNYRSRLHLSAWYVAQPVLGRAQAPGPLNQISISFPPRWTKSHIQPQVCNRKAMLTPLSKAVHRCIHAVSQVTASVLLCSNSGLLPQGSTSRAKMSLCLVSQKFSYRRVLMMDGKHIFLLFHRKEQSGKEKQIKSEKECT